MHLTIVRLALPNYAHWSVRPIARYFGPHLRIFAIQKYYRSQLSIDFILNAFFSPRTTASVICTSTMSPILNTCGFAFVYLHAIQYLFRFASFSHLLSFPVSIDQAF